MACPHWTATAAAERSQPTALGYRTFRCRICWRSFKEHTGTPFDFLEYPTDLVLLVVLCCLRYKLSLHDLARMFLERGFVFTHRSARVGGAVCASAHGAAPRQAVGKAGRTWCVDETYVMVRGRWCCLYRAIDRDGNLVDWRLSETRDLKAAQRFFRRARAVAGHAPDRVTADGHDAYPRAIRRTLGRKVVYRRNRYLNNWLEQDHRGIKQRSYPLRGFGSFAAAARFCTAHDELRDYFRYRQRVGETVPLAKRRQMFRDRWATLMTLLAA